MEALLATLTGSSGVFPLFQHSGTEPPIRLLAGTAYGDAPQR